MDSLRKGYFDINLKQYCALGFSRSRLIGASIRKLTNNDENGVFHWSGNVLLKIGQANLAGCQDLCDKQLVLIGYFFELGYELMLSANQDVSENPGFESLLGIFSNGSD